MDTVDQVTGILVNMFKTVGISTNPMSLETIRKLSDELVRTVMAAASEKGTAQLEDLKKRTKDATVLIGEEISSLDKRVSKLEEKPAKTKSKDLPNT